MKLSVKFKIILKLLSLYTSGWSVECDTNYSPPIAVSLLMTPLVVSATCCQWPL